MYKPLSELLDSQDSDARIKIQIIAIESSSTSKGYSIEELLKNAETVITEKYKFEALGEVFFSSFMEFSDCYDSV